MAAGASQRDNGGMADEAALRSLPGELVLLVAEQARRIPLQRYLTSVLMGLLLLAYLPPALPLLWLSAVLATVAVRTRVVLALPDDDRRSDEQKLRLIARLFWISGAAQAAVIGFFAWVPALIGAVITIYIVGICSATLHATAGNRTICLPYTLLMMLPVVVAWSLAPNLEAGFFERLLFAALSLIYITTLLSHARGLNGVFMESYNIRLQRIDLNRRLRDALDKAETASHAKTRFLASASHDLRQPIHALSLFTGSLLLRPMDARTGAIARQIDQAVKSLASQLDALLDISRLDAGVIERNVTTLDLSTLLRELGEESRPQADGKGLRLSVRCAPGLQVRSDPMLLQRVIRNLLSNAVKYTERGSVELSAELRGERCRISVRDTGPGIPPPEHAHIFEEFYQLQNPERDRSKGLGLGLAIVRRLTELLDVPLGLESSPGSGSCFWIELPHAAASPPPLPQLPDESAAPDRPQIQVLVIDDEEAIRLGMKILLEEMGFGVEVAPSTEAALELSRQRTPSLVLADFRLRGQDSGMRAIHALRGLWPDMPALLISGDTAPDRLREARSAGIELLHKPVAAPVLRETILRAVATAGACA